MPRTAGGLIALALVAGGCGAEGTNTAEPTGGTESVPQSTINAPVVEPSVPLRLNRGAFVELVAGVTERETSPGADGEAVNAVVAGTNDFAVRFFKTAIEEAPANAVIGNYSLSTVLLLTMAGTRGATTDAFADLLGVGSVDPAALHRAVNAVDLILDRRVGDGLEISTANKLFVKDGLSLRPQFLDTAVGSYGAPVAAVDFAGARDDVVAAVNGWVSEQTDGFIEELTEGYPSNAVMVLANAMYLKASWAVEFHRLSEPGEFTTADGTSVQAELMGHDEFLPLNSGPDFVAVELPYAGGNLSMVVIQPTDLSTFEADLTAARLQEITDGLSESGIHLTMPIWSTNTSIEALDLLHEIGLPTEYDFGAMFEGGEAAFIGSVSHVAHIEVDETGTTAAAGSDVLIALSHGPTVTINRPFFYFIRDRGSQLILFMGHVTDPTQSG